MKYFLSLPAVSPLPRLSVGIFVFESCKRAPLSAVDILIKQESCNIIHTSSRERPTASDPRQPLMWDWGKKEDNTGWLVDITLNICLGCWSWLTCAWCRKEVSWPDSLYQMKARDNVTKIDSAISPESVSFLLLISELTAQTVYRYRCYDKYY